MSITGKQIIGYTLSQMGSREFHGLNASTGEIVGPTFYEASTEEVDMALKLAKSAFSDYRKISDLQRADFLLAIIEEINAIGDDLIKTACLESGLPEARITGERGRTTGQIKAFADFISNASWRKEIHDPALPARQPLAKPDLFQKQIPLGPSVIFGASNFPLAFSVAGGDTMSALAAGCPVVFKAHPAHPNTCELIGIAIQKAAKKTQMPEGVFSMIHAKGHEIGGYLVTHPITQALGFTGSYRGGKALYDLAVRRPQPIPVYAEMGSVNPVVLLSEKINLAEEALAEGLSQSVCMGVGQFCTNPGLLILLKSDEGFLDLLASKLNNMPLGTFLTKGIKDAYTHGTQILANHSEVHLLTTTELPSPALFKILAKSAIKNPDVLEEVFGPCTLAVVAENMSEMIEFIEQLAGQLTATIHGELTELKESTDLIEALTQKVGRILLNGFPTGVEVSGAMVHGGPFPSTTDARSTSVGTQAIYRFTRPVCFQNFTSEMIP
jgi:NADP-dependent aldehyde dehydrogenase